MFGYGVKGAEVLKQHVLSKAVLLRRGIHEQQSSAVRNQYLSNLYPKAPGHRKPDFAVKIIHRNR
jgi:hypothetical protein